MATYDSVLEVLTQAPLTAKEVEEKLKEAGHSTKAVPTTLSELKAKGKVTYDTPGGPWRVIDEKGELVAPEKTNLADAMLAEITKKPLAFDALRKLFGKSTKTTLQALVRQRKVANDGRGQPWHVTRGHGKTSKVKGQASRNHAPTGLRAKLLAVLAKEPLTHKALVTKFRRDVSVPLARLKAQGKVDNDGPGTPWRLTGARRVANGEPAKDVTLTAQILADIAQGPRTAKELQKRFGPTARHTTDYLRTLGKITRDGKSGPWHLSDDAVDTLTPLKVTERTVKRAVSGSSPARSQRLIDKAFRKGADSFINEAIARRAGYIKKIAALDAVILAETEDE